jgi:hypothetical protein
MVFTYRKCIALFLSLTPTPPSADGGEKVYKRHRGDVSISTFNGTVFLALMAPLGVADTLVLLAENSSQCSLLGEPVSGESFWRSMY